jgi:hypothetical protein
MITTLKNAGLGSLELFCMVGTLSCGIVSRLAAYIFAIASA